jgi:hypothetical protein
MQRTGPSQHGAPPLIWVFCRPERDWEGAEDGPGTRSGMRWDRGPTPPSLVVSRGYSDNAGHSALPPPRVEAGMSRRVHRAGHAPRHASVLGLELDRRDRCRRMALLSPADPSAGLRTCSRAAHVGEEALRSPTVPMLRSRSRRTESRKFTRLQNNQMQRTKLAQAMELRR